MHKVRHNWATLALSLAPTTPLLVKAGGLSPDPSLPDMQFVRTLRAPDGETIYIPGPSLKGVLRTYVEKILRTVKGNAPEGACDPFADTACSERLKDEERPATIYRLSCRACRLFGNTKLKGRIACLDAYPTGEVETEVRHGVAISRLSQAVAVGPFDMEVALSGVFGTRLLLENFEAWQLGLLALALRDINAGLVRIGFGKNRGFGEMAVRVEEVTLGFAMAPPSHEVWGIGVLMAEAERSQYDLSEEDRFRLQADVATEEADFFGVRRKYPEAVWLSLAQAALSHAKDVLS
jgi:CRISPR-associated RAMP protein (TIGR02581 family)